MASIRKRSFSDIAQDDLKHLKGFGFSKFGKRNIFEDMKIPKDKSTTDDYFNQKPLKRFGFSYFGKRSEFRKMQQKKEDLKYLSGFGFSKLGKRHYNPNTCACSPNLFEHVESFKEKTGATIEHKTKESLQN